MTVINIFSGVLLVKGNGKWRELRPYIYTYIYAPNFKCPSFLIYETQFFLCGFRTLWTETMEVCGRVNRSTCIHVYAGKVGKIIINRFLDIQIFEVFHSCEIWLGSYVRYIQRMMKIIIIIIIIIIMGS
jgi:hypothetical protein